MKTETNQQIATNFLLSADAVDFDTWRGYTSPDLVGSANGGDAMNRDELEAMVRGITEGFSDARHIVESQVADGHTVATRLTWTARHTGDFNGVPASNRPVRIGRPLGFGRLPNEAKGASFAVPAGLLVYPQYAHLEHVEPRHTRQLRTGTDGYFGKVGRWLREGF